MTTGTAYQKTLVDVYAMSMPWIKPYVRFFLRFQTKQKKTEKKNLEIILHFVKFNFIEVMFPLRKGQSGKHHFPLIIMCSAY